MIRPMKVALQIEDLRGADKGDTIGSAKQLFGLVGYEFKTGKEVKVLVYEAMKSELENNGHRVISAVESNPDVIIEARVKKLWIDANQKIGVIIANVSIMHPRDKSIFGQRLIIGTFRGEQTMLHVPSLQSTLNGALVEFVRNFSRDPDLLDAFGLAQQEAK